MIHEPKPWACSGYEAVFCALHGDCTCTVKRVAGTNGRSWVRTTRDPACVLHGDDTDHPRSEPTFVPVHGSTLDRMGVDEVLG